MNKVILQGRMAKDPFLAYTQSNTAKTSFTIAVDRFYGKEKQADFINCVAWGKTAESINKFFVKGKPILVEGNIKTGSYEKKDGTKAYTTDIWVERFEFVPADKTEFSAEPSGDDYPADSFEEAYDDMPF